MSIKSNQAGRSMIEMLGVLAIVGVFVGWRHCRIREGYVQVESD